MANFLVLETATDICSVAIVMHTENSDDGAKVLAQRSTANFRDHGRIITSFIEECLTESQLSIKELDAVAVSSGPGSFTSLRIGAGTAKGICFGRGIPLIAIDTLQALALAAQREEDASNTRYVPMIDARSMGVFIAIYDQQLNLLQPLKREKLDNTFGEGPLLNNLPVVCCGPAAEKYRTDQVSNRVSYRQEKPLATYLIPLVIEAWKQESFADLAYFEPNYVAPPNITTPKKKK